MATVYGEAKIGNWPQQIQSTGLHDGAEPHGFKSPDPEFFDPGESIKLPMVISLCLKGQGVNTKAEF
jgi:hypothetical protein